VEIELIIGDITTLEVDAIVNAANTSLLGGGGVDGAIHRAGGKEILEDCIKISNRQGGINTGEAVVTTAGRLKARKVIHTAGPIWNGGNSREDEKLRNCYLNSLKLADEFDLKTIAFPNISTGIYGFPKSKAAKIAIEAVTKAKIKNIRKVIFVCFDEFNLNLYKEELKRRIR
jgi:O-acetyl-ADP-ribose deacetylase (regulator of RNase III)